MTIVTLDLGHCTIQQDVDTSGGTFIGGIRALTFTRRWFQKLSFVAALPSNTWGALATYVKENEEALKADGVDLEDLVYLQTASTGS